MLVMTRRSPDGLANTQDGDLRALRISDKRYAVPDLKRSSGRGKQRCRISNTAYFSLIRRGASSRTP